MIATIRPSKLSGVIQAPASKSSMQRACAASLLAKRKSIILHPGYSDDDKAAIGIIKALGAEVEMNEEELTINSRRFPLAASHSPLAIDCGESGLSIRMFTPIAALSERSIVINGSGSLVSRPMDFFDKVLPQLGVTVKSNDGRLPLTIQGPLKPKDIEVDGSLSSQFLTGLLMAYAATGAANISIRVTNLKSKPYIDLTLDVMKQFGLNVPQNRSYKEFWFEAPTSDSRITHHASRPLTYPVERDWSGASFLLVAGAIAGPISINGLDMTSTQADKAVMDALDSAGAIIASKKDEIMVKPSNLKAFDFDATDCPDLFPPLVALAACCNGKSGIKGVNRLAHKESDRAASLKEEFGKLGIRMETVEDTMIVHGSKMKGAKLHSHHDHRIAMACAVAGLAADGTTTIEGAEVVSKSYPDFYDHLKKLGAAVSLTTEE